MSRVVAIDDEDIVREVIANLLERDGYDVVEFDDGAPALEAADLETADLILTDLAMPTPGERVIEAVRQQGISTPIVVLTGVLESKDMDRLMALGADRVLEKPIQAASFLSTVELLLSGSPSEK